MVEQMARSKRKTKRKKIRHGLSALEKDRLKERLRIHCCSESWVDAQIRQIREELEDGRVVVTEFHDRTVYPVPGMLVCRICNIATPSTAIDHSTGICLDCYVSGQGLTAGKAAYRIESQDAYGVSPFHEAMEKIRMLHVRLRECSRKLW